MKSKPKSTAKGVKPLYRLKFVGGPWDGQYYAGDKVWQGVSQDEADKLDHKAVRRVQNHMKRPGIRQATVLEPV